MICKSKSSQFQHGAFPSTHRVLHVRKENLHACYFQNRCPPLYLLANKTNWVLFGETLLTTEIQENRKSSNNSKFIANFRLRKKNSVLWGNHKIRKWDWELKSVQGSWNLLQRLLTGTRHWGHTEREIYPAAPRRWAAAAQRPELILHSPAWPRVQKSLPSYPKKAAKEPPIPSRPVSEDRHLREIRKQEGTQI